MSDIDSVLKAQRKLFQSGKTKMLAYRVEKLWRLKAAVKKYEAEITLALRADLNKSPFEAYVTEIGIVLEEIEYIIRHLSKWARPKRVGTPLVHFPSSSYIYQEPYGVVLIMSPWNYPFQLTFAPLVGAIAAGNCVVVKPSEYSPHTSQIIDKIISEVFNGDYVTVVRGGREANQTLLEQQFDYIFFTGSVPVGKLVMESASRHLTPVTLELGGKSPCIVDRTANLELAARRIIWGKFLNAGQTCVAPDYVFVHSDIKQILIEKMKKYIVRFYGADPLNNTEYPKIINTRHYDRLRELMTGADIAAGGQCNKSTRQIAPTLIDHVTWDSPVMQEEIFGPLLPILEFGSFKQLIAKINQRPKPLAFYLFTGDPRREAYAIRHASFGGGCINDTIIHLGNSKLPFGGVGESGMGSYHGKGSFETFSHSKSIVKKSNVVDIPLRYPPYKKRLKLVKRLL